MLSPNTVNALASRLGNSPGKELAASFNLLDGPGAIWYVSSLRGSASYTGTSWNDPLLTLQAAINLASDGDTILVDYFHNEGLGSGEAITISKSVTIVGLGHGTAAPIIDFDHATATIDITDNSVTLCNVKLRPSVATVAIGIDINANVTDTRLIGLEILDGEDGAGNDEFVIGIDLKAGCKRTLIDGLRSSQHASADGATHAIKLTGASDKVTIRNCWLYVVGTAAVAPIGGITTLSTNLTIENCTLISDAEPGIEVLTGTTGVIRDVDIFSNLATIAAATVADGMAHFRVSYVEVGAESGAVVGTASAND